MKNLLKKSEMARLFALLALACACVGMWGCSDRVEFKWVGRGNMSIAGFIDDSLVVAYDCRGWLETTETWNGGYSEDESCGHDRLLVFNYRVQEDGPRWTDSLTNKSGGYRWYQLTDSIFWRWDGYNILLWKLGETAHEMKLSRKNEGCLLEFEINRMHQWLNDGFIVLGGRLSAEEDSCQYAVLDTIAGTLTFKRLSDDLEWIKECDDVKTWDDDVYCLKFDKEERTSSLFVNDNLKYILENDYFWTAGAVLQFQGHILLLERDVCRLENGKIKCFASASSSGISFKNREDDVYITY